MLSDAEMVAALEQAGLEVEQVIASKPIDKKVVVGLTKKVVQHPSADRLRVVEVETGEGQFRVVCGAPNVREGLKVAFAQIGAILPSGDRIEKVKLRGEVSEGMLCSERELGLGNDHNGILELSSDAKLGTSLCDMYFSDTVIDLKTPANRFDVLSVAGVAREVAAMTGEAPVPLSPPPVPIAADGPVVRPVAAAVAGRYMLARVAVDQAVPSPRHIAARLRAAGMRAVGPVVDVTNYVMLETGQPLHAFDAAKVTLPIEVRLARAGESLTTLDGVERRLTLDDLVIADQGGPIALAGLMGGAHTEVGPTTTEILLESAVFDGVTVRKMAKRHGLRTEASARFERGLPVQLPPLGLARAVELLGEVAAGRLVAATDRLNATPEPRRVELELSRLSRLLGFSITHKEAVQALGRLGIVVQNSHREMHKDDRLVVPEVPWWRPDLKLPEDLVEEVVRVVGYDKVPATIPSWRPRQLVFDRQRAKRRRVRDLMYGAGLFEVMTYSFVSAQQLTDLGYELTDFLKLKNPLSSEQAYLRASLLPSHLAVLARNRLYGREVGFYEISQVFVKKGAGDNESVADELPDEPLRLGVMMNRPERSYAAVKGLLDALGRELNVGLRVEPVLESVMEPATADRDGTGATAVYAPGRSGSVWMGRTEVGRIGQLHPERLRQLKVEGEAAYVELDLLPLLEASTARQFAGVTRRPTIARDLAVVVPLAVTWQAVVEALPGLAEAEVAFVSDYYGAELPQGHKSLALRLTLSHPDRTPTEAEAMELETKALRVLERKFGAKRRVEGA